MKRISTSILLCAGLLNFGSTQAQVLYFDDITPEANGDYATMSSQPNYDSFIWDDFSVVNDDKFMIFNSYGAPSGPNAINNDNGRQTVTISSITPFSFIGADFAGFGYFNSADPDFTSSSITVSANSGGTQYSQLLDLSADKYSHMSANFQNITTLTFTASGAGKNWLMDNLEITPVPVPATFWLLGSGIVAMFGLKRKKGK